jgi:ABC-type glycerol-3-phosphate transport system substrate-binding protein
MKKILFIIAAMLLMFACGGNSTKQSEVSDSISIDSVEITDSIDSLLIDTISIH